jgi:hypothetical protein
LNLRRRDAVSPDGAETLVLTGINGRVSIPSDNTARSMDEVDKRAGGVFMVDLQSDRFMEPSFALRPECS